jgi:hypothetical protein
MYFLAALQANGVGSHIAIDPFELEEWKGIGLMEVKEVKMEDSFEFIPEWSHPALAKLADKKLTFDVMFIDGAHLYDIAFGDFVLADALCPKQGYILLHDTWMGSVQRIISFIQKNRLDFTRQPSSTANIAIFQRLATTSDLGIITRNSSLQGCLHSWIFVTDCVRLSRRARLVARQR